MTTIAITSDLHLGITAAEALLRLRDQIAAEQPDLTVLAGDLGEPLDKFIDCLAIFRDLPGTVAVLAGNHDLWARQGQHSRDLWDRDLPAATQAAGMVWLEATSWRLGDLAVVGSLAWYDYSAADTAVPRTAAEYQVIKRLINNDARFIDWEWSDPAFANRLGAALATRLQILEGDPTIQEILVVTHVPISASQIERRPENPDWGLSNAFFGNLTTGQLVTAFGKVRAIISGHTHRGRQGSLDRPGLPSIVTAVVPADYAAPAALVIDSATWELHLLKD